MKMQKGDTNRGSYPKGVKHNPISVAKMAKTLSIKYKGEGNPRFGVKVSEETRKKMSDAKKGMKAYQWIADRSKLSKSENRSSDYAMRDWAKNVKTRDNWKCRIANGSCAGRVEAHHILSWREYPDLRYKLNNGITLCHAHHPRIRAEVEQQVPFFQELVSALGNEK